VRYSHNGHQIRESSRSTVYEDADRLLKKRQGEIAIGRFAGLAAEQVTMAELIAAVHQDYRDNAYRSLPQLLSRLKRLVPHFGAIRAATFSSDHVKRYRSKRLKEGATRAAINREMEILARAWSLAQKCDPPKVTRPFHFPMFEENNVRTGFLEDEQYHALHSALPNYLKPLLLVGYHVPCRAGELTNLFMKQLDFKAKEIVLNPGETKNGRGRHMPMFGPILESLLMQKSIRDEKFPDCPYVFFGDTGERIVDFRKAWKSACKAAGIDEKTLFHDLRRSAARNMRRAGIAEKTIMEIGGWETNAMFRRYDIHDAKDLQRAGETMELWIASNGKDKTISTFSSTIGPESRHDPQTKTKGNRLN
jgi:integrase